MAWFRSSKKAAPQRQSEGRTVENGATRSDEIKSRYDEMKALARTGDLDVEWAIIVQEMFDVEREAIENQWMPAPGVYKRAAVSLRKQKRYALEVQILERFKRVNEQFRKGQPLYKVSAELYERLQTAKELRDSSEK